MKRLLKGLLKLLLVAAAARAGLELYLRTHPYPAERLAGFSESQRFLDRNGELLREVVNGDGERARWMKLEELSPLVVQATLAAEDDRFERHGGVDAEAVARAVVQDLRARRVVSGASTLTMQLARRLEPHSKSFTGKLGEMLDAWRLERALSKHDLLEQYLNRAPYGAGAIGVEAASRRYFGKPSTHLSLAEATLLAGLPKGPTGLNPLRNLAAAQERQGWVLSRLQQTGRAAAADVERARREPLTFTSPEAPSALHFTEWMRAQHPGAGEVRTTLDASLQREIEAMVRDHVRALAPQGVTNAAVVVLDNEKCDVLAMIGSADYWDPRDGSVNGALARRQPGSTLKPFTYALAFEKGHGPASVAADVETRYGEVGGGLFMPKNFSNEYSGPVLFHEALGRSLNVPAIRVAALFGADELLEKLHRAGFDSLDQPASHYGLGLTLGNGEVTLLELADAYAMLARGGLACDDSSRVFSAQVAGLVTQSLADEGTRMRAFGPANALMLPFPVAVKTGTSTNWRDNWAVGFTPRYTVAVWAGDFENRPMEQLAAAYGAGPLFHRVMKRVALRDGQPKPEPFAAPPDTVEVTVCAASGLLATDDCPEHRRLFVPKDQVPARRCDAHRKLDVDVRNGLLAGPSCPKPFTAQRVFEVLPAAYAQWQAEHPRRAPPSAWSPLCPRKGPVHGAVVVKWPRTGEVFLLEPGWDVRTQTLELRAEAEGVSPDVRWFVDGTMAQSAWPMVKGSHQLYAEAAGRRSDVVKFEVR